ncbi:hypothetical protein [Candidatus Thiosymbion oneisti]|uniref:hypothetical protein n=1 Tax=Candidatus Thiosymbion oneisti TaxID=589554 RepID=UPI0010602493|nr:hypothetical protein [Candidatus Thiosymbion oneisti]
MKAMKFIIPVLVILLLRAEPALAHIKWFVEFDIAEPPRQLTEVLNGTFWLLLLVASVGLLILYSIDIKWSRAQRFDWFGRFFSNQPNIVDTIARIGTGVFFVMLWLIGDVILAPDLLGDAAFLPYLHLFAAIFVLFESTMILSALCILALYGYGITQYGFYHMLDYMLFPGLAAYLVLKSIGGTRLEQYRVPLLVVGMLFSFLWVAIEKFAYPQWFDPFLDSNEFLTMGLPRDFFLMCAAFVEFTLVYVLLTGRNVVSLAALALNLMIIAGAVHFGKVDTIGHFLVIVILIIMTIKGPSVYSFFSYRENRGVLAQAGIMVMSYWLALGLMVSMYYGFHYLAYGRP